MFYTINLMFNTEVTNKQIILNIPKEVDIPRSRFLFLNLD